MAGQYSHFVWAAVAGAIGAVTAVTCVDAQSTMRGPRRNQSNMTSGTSGECSTSHVRMCDNCRINVTMRVTSGQTCHLSLSSPRPILSLELARRPVHGRFGSANNSDAAYMAPQGFAGSDSFALSIYRVTANDQKAGRMQVNVQVEVVP